MNADNKKKDGCIWVREEGEMVGLHKNNMGGGSGKSITGYIVAMYMWTCHTSSCHSISRASFSLSDKPYYIIISAN
jgi:hypothetical protein